MRRLFIAVFVGGMVAGCAAPRVVVAPAMSGEVEQWRRRYEEGREREEALAVKLAAAESALEELAQERADAAQLSRLWDAERVRAAAERHVLNEHNTQLMIRQRERAALQEELEDVWFQTALSRARRLSQPEGPLEPVPPPPVPAPVATP